MLQRHSVTDMNASSRGPELRIGLFGHFAGINLGNDSTLMALILNLRRHLPNARITCICTAPQEATRIFGVPAVPLDGVSIKPTWLRHNRIQRLLRAIIIGIPAELCRWAQALRSARRLDVFIVPGTGLLTDAFGVYNWGPYTLFRWTLLAKLCRCEVLYLSVGAGPLQSRQGKWFAGLALRLADYRSYRDEATRRYIGTLGLNTDADVVSADLALSLPGDVPPPSARTGTGSRPVIGLGVMLYSGEFTSGSRRFDYSAYLQALGAFTDWLISRGYDIRLLSGDQCDRRVLSEFRQWLTQRSSIDNTRIIEEPLLSVADLLSQLETTEAVVATRFHNVVLALLLNKPVISIAFHQKCVSLMEDMGLAAYTQRIEEVTAEHLIAQFCSLEQNTKGLKALIHARTTACRASLDAQYAALFGRATLPEPL